jgi:hypothetical protein
MNFFEQYCELSTEEQEAFLTRLSTHLLFHLPDGKFVLLSAWEYQQLNRRGELYMAVKHLLEE